MNGSTARPRYPAPGDVGHRGGIVEPAGRIVEVSTVVPPEDAADPGALAAVAEDILARLFLATRGRSPATAPTVRFRVVVAGPTGLAVRPWRRGDPLPSDAVMLVCLADVVLP